MDEMDNFAQVSNILHRKNSLKISNATEMSTELIKNRKQHSIESIFFSFRIK